MEGEGGMRGKEYRHNDKKNNSEQYFEPFAEKSSEERTQKAVMTD